MKLTLRTEAQQAKDAREAARRGTLGLLARRLRMGLWVTLASIALFALIDLERHEQSVLPLLLLRLLQAGVVFGAFGALCSSWPCARIASVARLAMSGFYVTTAAAAIVTRDLTTAPFLSVVVAMATATLLPWGARSQLVTVLVAALALLANVALVSGGLAVAAGYPGAVVAVALMASIYVAYEHERHRLEQEDMAILVAGQTQVLEAIAMGAPLEETLRRLSVMIEELSPGLLCSVLLLDGDRLRHGAAPSLPEVYSRAIDGIPIGPQVGSCGSAAYRREPVVVTDIASDPLWRDFRDLALEHGLRACWSAPIVATGGTCLGTFAMYYREPRSPGRRDWHRIQIATNLARVAIERQRTESALTASKRQLEEESQVSGTLVQVGREMMSSLSTPLILDRLCRLTTELLACECSDTVLRLPREDVYVPKSAHGYSPEQWESLRALRMPASALADLLGALEQRQLVQVRTASVQDPRAVELLRRYGITVSMYVALKRGDEVIGLLSAGYQGCEQLFTPQQQRIVLGIAQMASMALENARLVEELRNANQLKSEFVSTMSHELRTPLNVIMGYTEMLQEGIAPQQNEEALAKIRGSSLELLEMVEATLNLNRLEGGKDPPNFEVVPVRALLDELASEFTALARRSETVLRWEWVESVEIWSDRRKLKIVLKNLVSNALKFTPAGSVVVSCRPLGERFAFAVQDSGVGIAPEHLPVIFDMFRQGDSSDARSYSGVGLGLYIVRRLLAQLGGDIAVESTPGRGSTFTVTLPIAPTTALRATA